MSEGSPSASGSRATSEPPSPVSKSPSPRPSPPLPDIPDDLAGDMGTVSLDDSVPPRASLSSGSVSSVLSASSGPSSSTSRRGAPLPLPISRTRSAESSKSVGSGVPSHNSYISQNSHDTNVSDPTSPRLVTSSKFRTVEVPHPSLTTVVSEPPDEPVDEAAPFESIAIDPDAPSAPPLPTHRLSQSISNSSKRNSWKRDSKSEWGGFGVDAKGNPIAHGSVPVHDENGTARSASSPVSASASGRSTPRRHAPPAHPHPFSLPTTPNSPHTPIPTPAPQPHALGVKGVSTLDKFISRTRPQHLPPKSKNEDQEHLHEWEGMMAKSKEHEQERKKHEEQRRLEKERHILLITPKWETLLNDPEFSASKVRNNSISRQLWFEGVPPRLRGQAWSQAIGNPLALNKDAYRAYLRRAQKAHAQGRFPVDIAEQMEFDMDQTLRTLHVFQRGSPLRQDLKDLISAWVVYRSDQARGYAPCISLIAAMFLLVSSPTVAFLSMVNFLSRPCMSAFYNEVTDEIDAFYRVFENLQADMFPRIFANCKNLGLKLPESYFRSALVEQVPFAVACRLWDQIMLEGDRYIFRAALAIFGFLEPRLYYPDKEEILSVLEGRNAATNAIAQRERERAKLRGEEYEETLDGKLSVFGLQEDPLFEWLENDGWKDSRFERLVMRELPD